jgi:hypothetical protein
MYKCWQTVWKLLCTLVTNTIVDSGGGFWWKKHTIMFPVYRDYFTVYLSLCAHSTKILKMGTPMYTLQKTLAAELQSNQGNYSCFPIHQIKFRGIESWEEWLPCPFMVMEVEQSNQHRWFVESNCKSANTYIICLDTQTSVRVIRNILYSSLKRTT